MTDTEEKIDSKKFYNIVLDKPKTQIILCHTGRDASNYYNSLKYRMDGDYTKIPHYMITKEGRVVDLIPPGSTSEFFGKKDVDSKSIFIILENLGWLARKPELNNYVNWIGDIYKGEVFRKKWRGHLFWANYTPEQLDSCAELIVQLNKELGVELEYTGHNVRIDSVDKFRGIVSRSNYNNVWTDISPAFNFEELIEKIGYEKNN
jgi:N-acetyl-anhydromuramyl-L-alanine amidase AmpD|tara:strand:+ start:693 stop:1307 length:615 start_codon:yes stop_codon:yes gene_type:complete